MLPVTTHLRALGSSPPSMFSRWDILAEKKRGDHSRTRSSREVPFELLDDPPSRPSGKMTIETKGGWFSHIFPYFPWTSGKIYGKIYGKFLWELIYLDYVPIFSYISLLLRCFHDDLHRDIPMISPLVRWFPMVSPWVHLAGEHPFGASNQPTVVCGNITNHRVAHWNLLEDFPLWVPWSV